MAQDGSLSAAQAAPCLSAHQGMEQGCRCVSQPRQWCVPDALGVCPRAACAALALPRVRTPPAASAWTESRRVRRRSGQARPTTRWRRPSPPRVAASPASPRSACATAGRRGPARGGPAFCWGVDGRQAFGLWSVRRYCVSIALACPPCCAARARNPGPGLLRCLPPGAARAGDVADAPGGCVAGRAGGRGRGGRGARAGRHASHAAPERLLQCGRRRAGGAAAGPAAPGAPGAPPARDRGRRSPAIAAPSHQQGRTPMWSLGSGPARCRSRLPAPP